MPLKKVKQKTVVDQVMDQIKELIASGEYKPGDKIPTEMELAKDFGLGRSSIREAIKIFNYLGVLESRAAIGTIVRERSQISTEALTKPIPISKSRWPSPVFTTIRRWIRLLGKKRAAIKWKLSNPMPPWW